MGESIRNPKWSNALTRGKMCLLGLHGWGYRQKREKIRVGKTDIDTARMMSREFKGRIELWSCSSYNKINTWKMHEQKEDRPQCLAPSSETAFGVVNKRSTSSSPL
jgi:hypothetical protein